MSSTLKLYKFRSLTQEYIKGSDLERATEIIKSGKFWHTSFSELNDPMEGTFTAIDHDLISHLYEGKARYKLCSFSQEEAFKAPLMWAHYANGFKGLAIEIEVKSKELEYKDIYKVRYVTKKLEAKPGDGPAETVKKILTRKFSLWGHESEYRSLITSEKSRVQKIGTIKALYFGYPYENAVNREAIYKANKSLTKLKREKEQLLKLASEMKIPCYSVKIENGVVVINNKL